MSGELHAASLLRMNFVMKCLGIQPVRNHLDAKLLSSLILVVAVGASSYKYYSFDFSSASIFRDDPVSVLFDMCDFTFLMAMHVTVVVERIWLRSRQDVDDQLEGFLQKMNECLGQQVNLRRVRAYCNAVYGSLFIRCLMHSLSTAYINKAVIYYILYSDLVLLSSFTEFTLYCVVILALYQDLTLAGSSVLRELDRTRLELRSVRRLSLEKLQHLQRLHKMLWLVIRSLENTFNLSLIFILMMLFMDSSALPYWLFLDQFDHTDVYNQYYCGIGVCVKILEVVVPCWICTRCDVMQQRLRSMFYTLTKDRRDGQLNAALSRLCLQLGQERCQFSAGGLVEVSTEMLGKFLFGMVSYIVICIQFSLNLMNSHSSKVARNSTTSAPF